LILAKSPTCVNYMVAYKN